MKMRILLESYNNMRCMYIGPSDSPYLTVQLNSKTDVDKLFITKLSYIESN